MNDESARPLSSKVSSMLGSVSLQLNQQNPKMRVRPRITDVKGRHQQEFFVDPRRVKPLPEQPRSEDNVGFSEKSIEELAESIKAIGQQQPGKVCRTLDPNYDVQLIDAERRLRACLKAGVEFSVVFDEKIDPNDNILLHAVSVARNLNNVPLSNIETARAMQKLKESGRMSVKEIAATVGMQEAAIFQYLSLLKLPLQVQKLLSEPSQVTKQGSARQKKSALSFAIAILLSTDVFSDKEKIKLANRITSHGMSDAAARRIIFSEKSKKGHSVVTRPRRQAEGLIRLTEASCEKFGIYLDMNKSDMAKIIEVLSVEERNKLVTDLDFLGNCMLDISKMFKPVADKTVPK